MEQRLVDSTHAMSSSGSRGIGAGAGAGAGAGSVHAGMHPRSSPDSTRRARGDGRGSGGSKLDSGTAAGPRRKHKHQVVVEGDEVDRAQTGHGNIGCCLCSFIVVSVVIGIIAVTSISFVAFFQADFHSYELVYKEAAEFLNTDIVHTTETVSLVAGMISSRIKAGTVNISSPNDDPYFGDMKLVLRTFDSVYVGTPTGFFHGAGGSPTRVNGIYYKEPGTCFDTFGVDQTTGRRNSTLLHQDCSFVVTERPWYTAAVAAKRGVWSDLYVGAVTKLLMTTYSLPVYNSTGQLVAVVGIDMPLTLLQTTLTNRHATPAGTDSFAFVFSLPDYKLLSTTLASDQGTLSNLWTTATESSPVVVPTISNPALSSRLLAASSLVLGAGEEVANYNEWVSSMVADPVVVVSKPVIPGAPELNWRAAIVAPARDRVTVKRNSFAQSAMLIVVVLATSALACYCVPSMRWQRDVHDTDASLGGVEMQNLAHLSKATDNARLVSARRRRSTRNSVRNSLNFATVAKKENARGDLFADSDSDEEGANGPKLTKKQRVVRTMFSGDGITTLCIVALAMSYSVWNFAGMVEFDQPVKELATTSNFRLAGSVSRVLTTADQVVELNIQAMARGELPVTTAQLNNAASVQRMQGYFVDLLLLYNSSTNPIHSVYVGFDHGASYGATFEPNGVALRYTDNTTQGRLVYRYLAADGKVDMSGPPIRELVLSVVEQPWFTAAVFNQTTVGSVYTFTAPSGAPSLGFTVSQRFVSRGVTGVVAVNVDLAHLQDVIRGFGFDADAASIFIAEQTTAGTMRLVAASAGARFELPEDRAVERAVAQDSDATLIAETSGNIDEEGGLAAVRGQVLTAGQGVERVWMSVTNITVGALQWDLIVAFRQATFTVGIRDWQDVAFLVGGGSIIIIGFVTVSAIAGARRKAAKEAGVDLQDIPQDRSKAAMAQKFDSVVTALTMTALSEQSMAPAFAGVAAYLKSMAQVAIAIRKDGPSARPTVPYVLWQKCAEVAGVVADRAETGLKRADQLRVARWIVEASLQGVNPVRQLAIHVIHRKAKWPLLLYRVRQHPVYSLTLLGMVMGLLGITFVEARVGAALDDSLVRTVLALEVLLLAVLAGDLGLYWLLHIGRTARRVKGKDASESIEYTVVGKPRQRVLVGAMRTGFVVVMFLDWCVRTATHYATGAQGANLFVPWTVLLRPAMLFSMSPVLRHATVNLALTIYQSKLVFALGASFVMVAAVTSGTLLSQATLENSEGLGRGFTDFRSTFLTMFIFLATGENYPDVVDEPVKTISPWFAVYFMMFSFVGMFLLMSLLVAYFQKYYVAEYDAKESINAALITIRRRAGLLLAFFLLKDLETQANTGMSRALRMQRAKNLAARNRAGHATPRLAHTLQHARVLASPTKIRRETFDQFFVSSGVRLPTQIELRRRNRDRFEAFQYDTEHFIAQVQHAVVRGGCDESFLHLTNEYAERCKQLHVQARKSLQVSAVDIAAFVMECERLSDKLLEGNQLADVEAMRSRASIVSTYRMRESQTAAALIAATAVPRRTFQQVLRDFFDDKMMVPYESAIVLVLMVHTVLLSLTLSKLGQFMLSYVAYLSILYMVEIGLRIHSEGWRDFWTFSRLEKLHKQVGAKSYGAAALRYDFCIVFFMMVMFIATRIAENRITWPADDPWRIVVALPVLRLLSTVHATRTLVFGLLASLPSFLALFGLLAVLHYCYAVFGVVWFAGKITANNASAATAGVAFDTLTQALRTLFQLMTGEAWNDIMYASVDAHGSLGPTIYYISYVSFVLLLFSNVFIGLVVDRFQNMEDEKNKDKKEMMMQRRIKRFQRIQGVVLKRRITRFIRVWVAKHRARIRKAAAAREKARRRAARRSHPGSNPSPSPSPPPPTNPTRHGGGGAGSGGNGRRGRGARPDVAVINPVATMAPPVSPTRESPDSTSRNRRQRLVNDAKRNGTGSGAGSGASPPPPPHQRPGGAQRQAGGGSHAARDTASPEPPV